MDVQYTHTHTHILMHMHTLTKHIHMHTHTHALCTYVIFLHSRCFNDMLREWPVHSELSKDHATSNHTAVCASASVTHISPSDKLNAAVFFGPVANDFLVTVYYETKLQKGEERKEGESVRAKHRGNLIIFNQR